LPHFEYTSIILDQFMCGVQQYPLMIAESPILRIVFGALGVRCVYRRLLFV
jgi:hypothetical protein